MTIDVSIARSIALSALTALFSDASLKADDYVDMLIQRHYMDKRDAALAYEIIFGVIRNRSLLDYELAHSLRRNLKHTPLLALNILRMALYQKNHLQRIPDFAIVNESVNLARRTCGEKIAKLINAVLRKALQRKSPLQLPSKSQHLEQYFEIKYSFPVWLVRYLRERFGDADAEWIMALSNKQAPIDLRVNILKSTIDETYHTLIKNGFHTVETMHYSPVGLRLHGVSVNHFKETGLLQNGVLSVQDEAAQLISYLVSPEPGDVIVDYCAAPGGKTTHMAELCADKALIYALDNNPERLEILRQNCARLRLSSVRISSLNKTFKSEIGERKVDKILIDAPCTSLGTLRRNPDIRWVRRYEDINRMASIQFSICRNVINMLKPGGIFVYSVCTFTQEETSGIVERLQEAFPYLVIESARHLLPLHAQEITTPEGFLSMAPHRHGTDGFFAVRFRYVA